MREATEAIVARAPEHDIDPTLVRVERLLEVLGDPQRSYPIIHVTGTNGKTSTARMIEALLVDLGLPTGRFTSPHLHDIRERIVLSGEPVSAHRFLATFADVMPFVDLVDARGAQDGTGRLSFFEVLVAMAYAAFADAPVETAVVEVGLGGAWDATNVGDGAVAVIGPVALDHERYLGSSLEEIAAEKAGIMKPGSIVVSAEQDPAVAEIVLARAGEVGAPVVVDGDGIEVLSREVAVGGQMLSLRGLAGDYHDLFLPLHGEHQAHNALLALAAVEAHVGGGEQALDLDTVRTAFAAVTSPGRLEVVRTSPTVLVDAAHNPAGAQALVAALADSFTLGRTVGLVACMADKDAEGILEVLEPAFDEVVVTRTTSPRAMPVAELAEAAEAVFGDHRVTVAPELPDALDRAAELADAGGVVGGVVATGSVFTAAEVRMLLGQGEA
ncbi:bifunctional folylpolyglutamate synthase/dihydrofolate synthase [Agilicoccus flavus]|uniref:bifunctional folylpolyglutamate synthase/dihydrofolate synthase n=1 Tax=Agilicoccus flavus TaxID=2775968 RepID=UPI001CF68B7A|nr:folylpolyglutamate synthase/dihydrofolate synthase family protein [Agilicoccus flavus]